MASVPFADSSNPHSASDVTLIAMAVGFTITVVVRACALILEQPWAGPLKRNGRANRRPWCLCKVGIALQRRASTRSAASRTIKQFGVTSAVHGGGKRRAVMAGVFGFLTLSSAANPSPPPPRASPLALSDF